MDQFTHTEEVKTTSSALKTDQQCFTSLNKDTDEDKASVMIFIKQDDKCESAAEHIAPDQSEVCLFLHALHSFQPVLCSSSSTKLLSLSVTDAAPL